MIFNSMNYLFFFPIVVLLYYAFPNKVKMYWLLIVSYYFYLSWNFKYGLLILIVTILTFICGLTIGRLNSRHKKGKSRWQEIVIIGICIAINVGILFFFKYSSFFANNLNLLLKNLGLKSQLRSFDIILPVGISFYIFQTIGYIIDVFRGDVVAEKNFFRYALFVSFFPQLVAGPIERSKNLLKEFYIHNKFDVNNVKAGLLTMAYGLFMKIVVADNIAMVINPIFENPDSYSGMMLIYATILFAFQIYCDFNGYTQIAIGSANVLGFKLSQNFNSPYIGTSVKDFWRRWHISLTSWFRDYLYIPLGGSKKGILRKQINTLIVFACSGLWHGAAWHYVIWGCLNGIFSILEDLGQPYLSKVCNTLKIKKDTIAYSIFQRVRTFIIIDFTWLFFRATSLSVAIKMLSKMFADFRIEWLLNFEFVDAYTDTYSLMVVNVSILIVILVDIAKYLGKNVGEIIFKQQIFFRWTIYALILLMILYWGGYGADYEQTQFIYFQF